MRSHVCSLAMRNVLHTGRIRLQNRSRTAHLDVAVGPAEPRLAVRRAHGKRGAAVLDGLLVPPELGVACGTVAEQHGVAGLPVEALAVGVARFGELGGLEEVVAAQPRRGRRLGPPLHVRDLPVARVKLARRLRRRHGVVEPVMTCHENPTSVRRAILPGALVHERACVWRWSGNEQTDTDLPAAMST